MIKLLLGDCLDSLKNLPDNSVDSIVSDPPYGLKFMGKKWDYDVPSVAIWRECLWVLKPGGYLLSFAGSRTYHVMAMRIENAGFEIRDQIMWIYGSGFPKSHNISKAIDKKVGAEGKVTHEVTKVRSKGSSSALPTLGSDSKKITWQVASPASLKWDGWGTALKPAHEPIVVAQKPISEDTVEMNVMTYGTGGLNIEGCRIGDEPRVSASASASAIFGSAMKRGPSKNVIGRWPSNVLFDEEASLLVDDQADQVRGCGPSRFFYVAKSSKAEKNGGLDGLPVKDFSGGGGTEHEKADAYGARKSGVNPHPTVKPMKLMEYLVRLVTPPGGVTLDPFMGSGSTGCAAVKGGWSFIGCELTEEYYKIADLRIKHALNLPKTKIRKKK